MNLFLCTFTHTLEFCVASVPLILVFLLLKVFRVSPQLTAIVVILNLIVSIFFWAKLRDLQVALYQSVPYISSFIWIWAEGVLAKRRRAECKKDSE